MSFVCGDHNSRNILPSQEWPKLFLHDDRGSVSVIRPRANAKLLDERERERGWGRTRTGRTGRGWESRQNQAHEVRWRREIIEGGEGVHVGRTDLLHGRRGSHRQSVSVLCVPLMRCGKCSRVHPAVARSWRRRRPFLGR